MQPVHYHQIGGYRAHLRDNSNDTLATRLMERAGGEFVLGIRPCGASYLLLPSDRFYELRLGHPAKGERLWRASDFVSLSPVQFPTKVDLAAKFSMLASNKKSTDGRPRDRSKANTAYTAGGEGLSPAGIARSSFEHQRVFYRLCQNTLERPLDYALRLAPWIRDVRIFSFAFNTWAADTRSLDEREADPKVLDVGWTEFNAPTDSADLSALSTSHYVAEEQRFLNNPGKKKLSLPDITQNMPKATISALLKDLFASTRDGNRCAPMILLVYDERMTRCILRHLGVDTSQWRTGIKDLLYLPGATDDGRRDRETYYDSKRDLRSSSGKWSRDRSRSPRRQGAAEHGVRPRSPPAPHIPPPVYIVDVRQMYQIMMQVHSRNDTVLSNAISLGVKDTAPVRGEEDRVIYQDVDPMSWCAGRESRLIGYMWEDMANSIAIDEQRALRQQYSKEPRLEAAAQGLGDNGEVDPNDMIQANPPSGVRGSAPKPVGMFDSDSEDDDY
ncbi:hypothetical protein BV20DRAFT_1042346 [Pilatotrama ljubarskyi]|nr:hypothetical protein BV20DRAFT_1042346 [Pilatotrama ljubarskyi]